jgi:hypothetical protein
MTTRGETEMDFESALRVVKKGGKIARRGWTYSTRWVELRLPEAGSKVREPTLYRRQSGTSQDPSEYEAPWVPCQADMLAYDWYEVNQAPTENEMRKLQVGTSPLTNRIYAGYVLKDGATWGDGMVSALQVLANGEPVMVTCNGKPKYEITVREL